MSRPSKRTTDTNESEDNNTNDEQVSSTSESNSVTGGGARTLSNSPTAILRSHIPESIDVFGFSITPGQFLLVQLAAVVMLGLNGCKLVCECQEKRK